MILQLLRQLNNLDRSKTIACSASFCFALSLRFPCPLPKRISSRILSKSMFISQNHPKSQQRVRTCAVIEKPVFRASLAMSMLEIELYQISLPYDRGRSGYEKLSIRPQVCIVHLFFCFSCKGKIRATVTSTETGLLSRVTSSRGIEFARAFACLSSFLHPPTLSKVDHISGWIVPSRLSHAPSECAV